MMSEYKDSIFAEPLAQVGSFQFDEKVAQVFPDMIQRSVPGYNAIISAIGLLAGRFAQPDSCCYDLGCSLGAASLSMRQHIQAERCKIIAVDNSAAMLNKFRRFLNSTTVDEGVTIDIRHADVRDIELENASVVVLNFTLQFIPPADRSAFLKKVYQGMLPGGILILSEKLKFQDARQQQLQTEMHHAFKKAQGYSDLEISQKRSALENVLIAETWPSHQKRLLDVGFASAEVWFQYFNFASMIALK